MTAEGYCFRGELAGGGADDAAFRAMHLRGELRMNIQHRAALELELRTIFEGELAGVVIGGNGDSNWLANSSHSFVRCMSFFHKVFQLIRHFLDHSFNVKTPQLLAHIRRRFHLQLLWQPLLRLSLTMLPRQLMLLIRP